MKAKLESGTVKIYRQLPTRYNINGVPHNLFKLPVSVAEDEGFFNVVEVIPTTYQAVEDLIESDFDGTNWIQKLRDFTTQEITDYDDNIVRLELQNEILDGVTASNQLKVYLKQNLTVNQYKSAREIMVFVWAQLRNGNWDLAKDELLKVSTPAGKLTDMKNVIMAKIDNYLGN